jgi:hypothetical protein
MEIALHKLTPDAAGLLISRLLIRSVSAIQDDTAQDFTTMPELSAIIWSFHLYLDGKHPHENA